MAFTHNVVTVKLEPVGILAVIFVGSGLLEVARVGA